MSRTATETLPEKLLATNRELRMAYDAAGESRFIRRRGLPSMGAGPDYHLNQIEWLRLLERARDLDRNHSLIGAVVDRAVTNTIQGGFTADPGTPDDKLNADLRARWDAWSTNRAECDISAQYTFADMEELVFRAMLVDGDHFALPLDSGQLQLVESHLCRTPYSGRRTATGGSRVVLGVHVDERNRPVEYWFVNDGQKPQSPEDMLRYPAYAGGDPLVFHVAHPRRVNQTRGVSAFAPILVNAGMFDDSLFAVLVKQLVSSCIAILRETPGNQDPASLLAPPGQMGPRTTETMADNLTRTLEEFSPGMEIFGRPGETLKGFSPQVAGGDFFSHVRLQVQLIGINLGVPLVTALMDASDTNFSGWRGAVDEARRGFMVNQRLLKAKLHHPVYRWKLRQWVSEDSQLAAAARRLGDQFWQVAWRTPRWPYIQPLQDAQADAERISSRLTSPRRLHAERGQDLADITRETIADNAAWVTLAIKTAQQISSVTGVSVDPRQLLALDPARELILTAAAQAGSEEARAAAEAADLAFRRRVVELLLSSGTAGDVITNMIPLRPLLASVGLPVNDEYEEPYLPVRDDSGALVSGNVIIDSEGDIVGGAVLSDASPSGASPGKQGDDELLKPAEARERDSDDGGGGDAAGIADDEVDATDSETTTGVDDDGVE